MPDAMGAVAPNVTTTLQATTCTTSPCLVCWLRKKTAEAPETQSVTFSEAPLELNLVGLRKDESLSDKFDDRMVAFFRVLDSKQTGDFEKAVEEALRNDFQAVLGRSKGCIKLIPCSQGLWIAALFRISTDPGLSARRGDFDTKLSAYDQELKQKEQQLAKSKAEQEKVSTRLEQAKKELASAKDDAAKKALTQEVKDLTKRSQTLTAELTKLDKRIKELEKAKKDVTEGMKKHDDSASEFELDDGTDGWMGEGRALIPPGHFRDYTFFIHRKGSPSMFAQKTSLAALTIGTISAGMCIYSVGYVCEKFKKDKSWNGRVVKQLRLASGQSKKFHDDTVTLELKKADKGEEVEAYYKEKGTLTKLSSSDQVLLRASIGGTNIHRAHHATLNPDGTLSGSDNASGKVASWSEGCHVFAGFDEFNLFLRLCAISKRWRCAAKSARAGKAECARLEVGTGNERGPGEEALVKRFGEDFVNQAADLRMDQSPPEGTDKGRASKVNAKIADLQAMKAKTLWTAEDEKKLQLAQEMAKGSADKMTHTAVEKLQKRKANQWTAKDEEKLAALVKEREAWRRAYLREKVRTLRADFMQVCDVSGKCKERFPYTLLELPSSAMDELATIWGDGRNKTWDGKLLVGTAK